MIIKTEVTACIKCPYIKFGREVSTDGFDRAVEVICGKTGEIVDGFYEHPGNEFIDRNFPKSCPFKI